ncbi:MAG: hypothetical protein ABSH02_04000 [Candidatus Sulfotelmatobacter sp.]
MKHLASILPFVLLAASSTLAQTPIPPGIRQADQAEAQTDKNIPPPATRHAHLDLARLSQDADDLARIAQTIPPDVAGIQKGLLPKDTIEKLKQIEKLSKQLRKQLSP